MAGWKRSWNSLVVRIMLSFTLYVVAMTALFTISPYIFVRDMLAEGLAGRGEARLKVVQGPVSGYLSLGMINSVQSHIAEVPKELTEISYVALADARGVFLAHSDPTQVEKPWSGKGVVPQVAGGATRHGTTYRGERILEVAAPILVEEKPAGTMIIGLNYREVDNILGTVSYTHLRAHETR